MKTKNYFAIHKNKRPRRKAFLVIYRKKLTSRQKLMLYFAKDISKKLIEAITIRKSTQLILDHLKKPQKLNVAS